MAKDPKDKRGPSVDSKDKAEVRGLSGPRPPD